MNRFLELTKAVAITAAMAAPIAAFAADDYSNVADATAYSIQVGEIYSGNIEVSGDVDVFKITTTKQALLAPYTLGATTAMTIGLYSQNPLPVPFGTGLNSALPIFTNNAALGNKNAISPNEAVKWTGGSPGAQAWITTWSLPPGTYYFRVGALYGGATGTYKFGLDYWDVSNYTSLAPAPYHMMTGDFGGNSIWHAWENSLNIGSIFSNNYGGTLDNGFIQMSPGLSRSSVDSFLFGGDIDYQIINVTTAGLLTGSSSYYSGQNTDTWGYLRDVNGNILSQNDDTGGLNFQVSARVNPGIYYLEIRHYNRMGGTGSYNWTVSMTP